jgi:hypothetical protein
MNINCSKGLLKGTMPRKSVSDMHKGDVLGLQFEPLPYLKKISDLPFKSYDFRKMYFFVPMPFNPSYIILHGLIEAIKIPQQIDNFFFILLFIFFI